jgi:hypothetical protein
VPVLFYFPKDSMRYPNLRYAHANELQFYGQGIPLKELAKRLRRSEKSVTAWLNGDRKVPYWVPELLRLQRMEHMERMRQMGMMSDFNRRAYAGKHLVFFSSRDTEAANDKLFTRANGRAQGTLRLAEQPQATNTRTSYIHARSTDQQPWNRQREPL